jgi:hypothetical protein
MNRDTSHSNRYNGGLSRVVVCVNLGLLISLRLFVVFQEAGWGVACSMDSRIVPAYKTASGPPRNEIDFLPTTRPRMFHYTKRACAAALS